MTTDAAEIAMQVEALLAEPIAQMGCRLLEVQFRSEHTWILRLIVDREPAVSMDDLSAISELAGRLLDVEDPIPQAYSLEVSSPGLFRPLTEPLHFEQSVGKVARMTLAEGVLPERRKRTLRGVIASANSEGFSLVLEDGTVQLPFDAVRAAKLDPDL